MKRALKQAITKLDISEFQSVTEHGVMAFYQRKKIFVGNIATSENGHNRATLSEDIKLKLTDFESEGKTVVGVFVEDKLAGLIAVADTVRDNA